MDPKAQEIYTKLCESLEGLIKAYRQLLQVVRTEKDILISADLDELTENNKTKETTLIKIRGLEHIRMRYSEEFAQELGLDPKEPRLLDFAVLLQGAEGERLRNIHSVLELLLKRVREHNQDNEVLIKSALESITGAMKAVRDSLHSKPTYERQGKVKDSGSTSAGALVSREV
jgi:flagellar biosynthesis/type III secretory pathway chaperone